MQVYRAGSRPTVPTYQRCLLMERSMSCKNCGKRVRGVGSIPVKGANRTYRRISADDVSPAAEVEQVPVDSGSGDSVGESVVSVDEVDAQDLADVSEPSPVKRKWLPFE